MRAFESLQGYHFYTLVLTWRRIAASGVSDTRRLRRDAARQQAQQRIRRMLAARRKRTDEGTGLSRLPSLVFHRRSLYILAALALGMLVAFPVLSPGTTSPPTNVDQTPSPQAPSPTAVSEKSFSAPPAMQISQDKRYGALLQTTKGVVLVEFFVKEVPAAVNNFVFLAQQGFYTGLPFYKVEPNQGVEAGAQHDDGTGGPGYTLPSEPSSRPIQLGTVAMIGQEGNTVDSRFLISMADQPGTVSGSTVFGRVVDGLDVVRQLQKGDLILSVRIIDDAG